MQWGFFWVFYGRNGVSAMDDIIVGLSEDASPDYLYIIFGDASSDLT